MVREAADGKRFLNIFAYTGAFTVYAAAGGAAATTTIDHSTTYIDWARENLELNNFRGAEHRLVRSDIWEFLDGLSAADLWDLAVVDPPTFSNRKGTEEPWDVERDHGVVLKRLADHIAPEGVVYFSSNFRRFHLDEAALAAFTIREITRQTIPEDFRNERIHRCWRLVRKG
jgi:23S rRNA (cytosine1962-C5)-methyltransferase